MLITRARGRHRVIKWTRCVFCRFFDLPILHSGHWFAAPLLSAHHMLGQWTGTSVDERFGTLIWLTPSLLVQYNIDRDQKKPVSTIFSPCRCSLIGSNSRSECQWKTRWVIPNRLTSTIRISHYELICSCPEWSCFAVSDLLQCCERIAFPVNDLLLSWQLTHSENVHINTRAKGNPVQAAREGSIIFRFERPTSRKSAKCNRKIR